MKTEKIQSSIITPRTTGYAAAAGVGITLLSGVNKNKTIKKIHKPVAWFTAAVSVLHIGLIEYYNYKFKHK